MSHVNTKAMLCMLGLFLGLQCFFNQLFSIFLSYLQVVYPYFSPFCLFIFSNFQKIPYSFLLYPLILISWGLLAHISSKT